MNVVGSTKLTSMATRRSPEKVGSEPHASLAAVAEGRQFCGRGSSGSSGGFVQAARFSELTPRTARHTTIVTTDFVPSCDKSAPKMTEIFIVAPVLAAFIAGVNAVMKVVSVYEQIHAHRSRRRRDDRHKTGKSGGERPDYTARPHGMSMGSGNNRRAHPYPHLPEAPNITNGSCSSIRRFSQVAGPSQQLAIHNSTSQLTQNASVGERRLHSSFGGVILLTPEQHARDTHKDMSKYGLSTGARPRGSSKSSETLAIDSAKAHWKSLKSSDYGVNTVDARAVAVVDFTHSSVTMFVEKHETYYRSYKVKSCPDIAGFVLKYQQYEVFSGEVVDGKLDKCNHGITLVEDDGECAFQSSNCWTKLGLNAAGIEREVARDPIFMEMVQGAVFGLICCVYKKPSSMNVDMRYGNGVDFVHVDTDVGGKLERGPDCCFSVFSIYNWMVEREGAGWLEQACQRQFR